MLATLALLCALSGPDEVLVRAWTAAQQNQFAAVRPEIEKRCAEERDDALARQYAFALAYGIDNELHEQPSADLIAFFERSYGGRRAEAAMQIARHYNPTLSPELRQRVVRVLIEQMLDERIAPLDRGRAIEAVQFFATDDEDLTQALLLLAQRDHWFDGVSGAHYLESSISNVIHALGERQTDRRVAQRLQTLPADLQSPCLGEFDRWLADGALKFVLRTKDP